MVVGLCRLLKLQLFKFLHLLFPDGNFSVGQVPLGMLRKMITSHEFSRAYRAGIFLFSSMSTPMTSKFI